MTFVILYRLSLCAYVILSLAAILPLSCELAFWFALRLSWCLVLQPAHRCINNDHGQLSEDQNQLNKITWEGSWRRSRPSPAAMTRRTTRRRLRDWSTTARPPASRAW